MTGAGGHLVHPNAYPGEPMNSGEPIAADVMRTDVLAVEESETVGMACELIARAGYHHLPVVREGDCVGIVDADALHAARLRGELTGHLTRVVDLHAWAPAEVSPGAPLRMVAERMLERRVDALLVRDESDRVVGLITVHDVVRAVASPPRRREPGQWRDQPAMFTLVPVVPVVPVAPVVSVSRGGPR